MLWSQFIEEQLNIFFFPAPFSQAPLNYSCGKQAQVYSSNMI